jgi:hypothetical protein
VKQTKRLIWVFFTLSWYLSAGCARGGTASPSDSSTTGTVPEVQSGQDTDQLSDQDYQRAKDAALAQARKEYEEALTNPPPRQVPLPNFMAGPGLPPPIGLNFYETRKYYPGYLLCNYDVDEKHYDQENEPAWFKAALLQIRAYGPQRFPPIKWIAVVIKNDAEHKAASTFEQSHKVGAMFSANEVFDFSRDLSQLIARAAMDRHPFVYDPKRPTPGEQDRWVIVERHAAATPATTNSNERAAGSEPPQQMNYYFEMDAAKQAKLQAALQELKIGDDYQKIVIVLGKPDYDQALATKDGKFVARPLTYYVKRWRKDLVTEGKDRAVDLQLDANARLIRIASNVDGIPSREADAR